LTGSLKTAKQLQPATTVLKEKVLDGGEAVLDGEEVTGVDPEEATIVYRRESTLGRDEAFGPDLDGAALVTEEGQVSTETTRKLRAVGERLFRRPCR